jgi:hypothetical protein
VTALGLRFLQYSRWGEEHDRGRKSGRSGDVDPNVKGDRVEIVVDTGASAQTYEIVATRAGRRVEVRIARGVVEVVEVTRTGNPVRTARFMSSRVLALVEHPMDRTPRA